MIARDDTPADPDPHAQTMNARLRAVAQSRDQAAFSALFLYYAPRIKSYLRRLGAEDAVAEELAQDAMLTVWSKAAAFDPERASASTWIFAIARNLRIDRLRHERRPEIDPDDPDLVVDPAPPADEALETGRREQRVRTALTHLPPDQARVVALSFFEDMPHAEIASRLDVPLGTVKSRMRLAMGRIKALLGESR
ncbi:sigma-70 family RNA polymerase sigma factor [Magnetospirillum fulvum]|uniref:RNA polymerase sigma factor n=1 Tax=Magnetospirillum fulvum MGU-K5 TaxID=1316936 RepID=S9TIE7_MAGFU|nr:sigma-70 family RNA polymerase sigma factor [Magnetospirillum fulvum]EPY02016.1 RNA polymerase sigma factor RpoE [Magnetospirillum fulvum MGU-K5]